MKKYSYLAGAAFLAIASSASFASITLQVTTAAIDSTLTANGWVGYDLTLVASGSSTAISAVDFHNVVTAQPGMPQSNIGISGDIHQEWGIKKNSTQTTSTPDDTTNGYDGFDSFFFANAGSGTPGVGQFGAGNGFVSLTNPATEDNNLANGVSNPPYTFSPETDIPSTKTQTGTNYGVGSLMTEAGAYNTPFTGTVELAFIIVPSSIATTINGVAVDSSATPVDWAISTVLNAGGPVTPEPASVGLVGLGGLALLARRRRKA